MTDPHPFFDPHTHGFIRLGASTPPVRTADIAANARGIIAEARRAHEAGVDLLLFPELSLSSYALDDLLLQEALIAAVEDEIEAIRRASEELAPVLVIGAPLRRLGRLYNCALVIARGRVLGAVPKSFLPNYREFYEKRHFAHGRDSAGLSLRLNGQDIPFGNDLIFAATSLPGFVFGIEICEDFWSPVQPGVAAALAGALILLNLSASPVTVGRADERQTLCHASSTRLMCAYAYSASGHGESTTDLAWDGQGMIWEMGRLLAQSSRFDLAPDLCIADIDTAGILQERLRTGTFNDAAEAAGHPETRFRTVGFDHRAAPGDRGLVRPVRRFPFVPDRPERLDEDCFEAFNIQVSGLMRRIDATGARSLVIGVSGGLDSTHALIVAAKACDRLGLARQTIRACTMPGFATSAHSLAMAWALMRALGVEAQEIDIRPAARLMLADIGHPFAKGDPVYDTVFENVQAGLRTDYLFRLAGQHGGFVIGTGDLSELALGWCTYGVGDQMSHYAVNAGVPKTLIQYLIRWVVRSGQFAVAEERAGVDAGIDGALDQVLEQVLEAEISPELVPAGASGDSQRTEALIGPYELNDFFLHHILRHGHRPSHVAFLAWHAWRKKEAGLWPHAFPEAKKNAYDLPTIRHWLERFCERFFTLSQFKRSAMPNGPKVSSGGALSPRGDWRAPSDARADLWLAELRDNLPPTPPAEG